MQVEIEKIFCNLIKSYLELPDNYGLDAQGNEIPTVIIKGQNIKLFNTDKLQITVSTFNSKVYANRKEFYTKIINQTVTDENTGEQTIVQIPEYHEIVHLNDKRSIQIDIYSRNNEARQRLAEVQMALSSTMAEQLQDKYQFRIGKISDAINLSGLDGGSDVNRYTIRLNCLCWYENDKKIDYYDKFSFEGYDENGKIHEWANYENNIDS